MTPALTGRPLTSGSRRARIRRGLVALLTCGTFAVLLVNGAGAAASDSGKLVGAPPGMPLDASVTAAGATWAELAMGRLDQAVDRFWELFVLKPHAPRWALVTPPGVADNGGLVTSTAPGSPVLVGFEASQDLGFSPLASTTSEGGSWQPAVLPSALAREPDALATSGGHALALLASHLGTVVASNGDLSSWTTLVTEKVLAASPAGRLCDLEQLTAVGYGPLGKVVIGGRCAAAGRVGLFERRGSSWHLAQIRLPGGAGGSPTTVLRASAADGSLGVLIGTTSRGRTTLVGAAPSDASPAWSVSRPLRLPAGALIESSGFGPPRTAFVLFSRGGTVRGEELLGPGDAWRELPLPPRYTSTLALSTGGRLDALTVNGSELTDYVLAAATGTWRRAQRIDVPIQYGSSG